MPFQVMTQEPRLLLPLGSANQRICRADDKGPSSAGRTHVMTRMVDPPPQGGTRKKAVLQPGIFAWLATSGHLFITFAKLSLLYIKAEGLWSRAGR